jgi:hypothetical protein
MRSVYYREISYLGCVRSAVLWSDWEDRNLEGVASAKEQIARTPSVRMIDV